MSLLFAKIQNEKFLFISLAVAFLNIFSNLIGDEVAVLVGNFIYVPISGALIFVASLLLKHLGSSGTHGMAWISLFGFAVMWFLAEMIWLTEEIFLNIEPYPSTADIFYLMGYPFLLLFLISYLEPVKKAITKEIFAIPLVISASVLLPCLFFALYDVEYVGNLDPTIAAAYPVADAFVIVPALIGIHLFFRGRSILCGLLFALELFLCSLQILHFCLHR